MARPVAFCLVENDDGQVLLVQRGYGKQKFKWSLPGGNCDKGERYSRAASRETREETGLRVEIISLIFEGRKNPIRTYFGKIKGGRLKAQRPECLDARFFDYDRLPPLAFSADHRALDVWQGMKADHARLASDPPAPPCPSCNSGSTSLRRYPHHRPYRCRSCNRVFSVAEHKEVAVSDKIVGHIRSEQERLGLLGPASNPGLGAAARDTAIWFAAEDDFEDQIHEYLVQRIAKEPECASTILFPRLAYGRESYPADSEPSEIARDLIEKIGLSEIVNYPDMDYLAVGSCHAVLDRSGNPVENSGVKPDRFGYALVIVYASDGNRMIVDRINDRREQRGADPLQISTPLRDIARKFITMASYDEAGQSLNHEAESHGYAAEGWRVRLYYGGCYAKFPGGGGIVTEPETADILAAQLVQEWSALLRPDWQDIGIAVTAQNNPELGGWNFQAEFVTGWRIPFDAERPAHFPPPVDEEGNRVASIESERRSDLRPFRPEPEPKRRRGWWPFRS